MKGCRNRGYRRSIPGCGVIWGWSFHTVLGVFSIWRNSIFVPQLRELYQDGRIAKLRTLPGFGAGSMYEPQSVSDRPASVGCPHRAGRCSPGKRSFLSTGCRSYKDEEGFMIQAWSALLPGWRWLKRTSDRPVRLRFPRRAERCQPGKTRFSFPRCRTWREF